MATAGISALSLSDAEHSAQLRRAVVASTVGSVIEAYDFLLYVLIAPLVFAKLYFPSSDPLVGTLQAFGIYAVGFISRPLGAAFFGHYGDRIGRKATLIATLLITGLATFAVGFVPSYASIGIWGAVILNDPPLDPGHRRRRRMGRRHTSSRWSGRKPTPIAGSSPRGRNGVRRPDYSSRTSPFSCSARFPAISFWTGAGACRSGSASSWSRSAYGSGSASSKRRCSSASSISKRSRARPSSRCFAGTPRRSS